MPWASIAHALFVPAGEVAVLPVTHARVRMKAPARSDARAS
jgi:hypothetical protein